MELRILKSLFIIGVLLAVAGYTSYAAFTASAVTIEDTSISTGSADLALCNADGSNNWKSSIAPGMEITDLVPGDTDVELTDASELYVGNDDGELDDNYGVCNSYGDPAGSSDVDLELIPKITNLECTDNALRNDISLRLTLDGTAADVTKTLNQWRTNTDVVKNLSVGDGDLINLYASLDVDSDIQDATCTFDFQFSGEQVL